MFCQKAMLSHCTKPKGCFRSPYACKFQDKRQSVYKGNKMKWVSIKDKNWRDCLFRYFWAEIYQFISVVLEQKLQWNIFQPRVKTWHEMEEWSNSYSSMWGVTPTCYNYSVLKLLFLRKEGKGLRCSTHWWTQMSWPRRSPCCWIRSSQLSKSWNNNTWWATVSHCGFRAWILCGHVV